MSLTNPSTDAVPSSFHGWTIAEAIERTTDPDNLIASASENVNSLDAQKTALWGRLFKGELVATGCFDVPTAPAVAIDPQNFHVLEWSGPPSTTLVGITGSEVEIFDVRVFPVLRAPNAANYLNGLPLTEAFRRFVIGDPEVAVLAQSVLKARPGEAAVFRDGQAPGPIVDFHWPLDLAASVLADRFVGSLLFIVGDPVPTPSASISAVSEVLADRITGLRDILVSGQVVAFGEFAQTGIEGPIGRFQWLRRGISIDVSNGDLCEGDDYRAMPKWTGLSLRVPDAVAPTNQPQNGLSPKIMEAPRKANAQIQTKQKSYVECVGWLVGLMKASPKIRTEPKSRLWAKAQLKWPKKFGLRAFEAAWTEAAAKAETPAWSAAGRPRKSPHS